MNNYKIETIFLSLLRAGLWEKDSLLSTYEDIDYRKVYQLAEEQSVLGLIAAGIEHVSCNLPKEDVLQIVGQALQLEQRNLAMNKYISEIVERMRKANIYALLLKGQGVAQCYERPHWRACGDIDFFLSESNYYKAIEFLAPYSSSSRIEGDFGLHQELIIDSWVVELHCDLLSGLSCKIDRMLEEINRDVFYGGNVRSWINGKTTVFLPSIDDDVIFIFTHIVKHLFKGGIGLRQVCDWCRILFTYRESLNLKLLESRIKKMGLTTEWRTFGALAVNMLGMPEDAMPLYSSEQKWNKKAEKILYFILETGNFGHNRDVSYQSEYTGWRRKSITLWNQIKDNLRLSQVFPLDSIRFLFSYMIIKTQKTITNKR